MLDRGDVAGWSEATNPLTVVAAEVADAHAGDRLRSILRRIRMTHGQAAEFWQRVEALANDHTDLERHGDTMHTLSVALYPSNHPTLPDTHHPTDPPRGTP